MAVVSDLINSGDCNPRQPFNNSVVEGLVQIDDEISSFYQSITKHFNDSLNQQTTRLNQMYSRLIQPLSDRLLVVLNNINRIYNDVTNDLNIRLQTTASQSSNYRTIPPEIPPTTASSLPEAVYPSQEMDVSTSYDAPIVDIPSDSDSIVGSTNVSALPASQIPNEPSNDGSYRPIDNVSLIPAPNGNTSFVDSEGIEGVNATTTTQPAMPVSVVPTPTTVATSPPIASDEQTATTVQNCCQQIAIAITQIGATLQQQQAINNYIQQIVEQRNVQSHSTDGTTIQPVVRPSIASTDVESHCAEPIEEQNNDPFCDIQKYKDLYQAEAKAAQNNGLDIDLYAASFSFDQRVGNRKVIPLQSLDHFPKDE